MPAIKVYRLIEYTGEPGAVGQALDKSLHGSVVLSTGGFPPVAIAAVTLLGDYSELLQANLYNNLHKEPTT